MTADERTDAEALVEVVPAVGALVRTVTFMLEGGMMTAAVVIELDVMMLLVLTLIDDVIEVELEAVAVVLVAVVVVVTPEAPTHWMALMKTGEHWPPVD